MPSSIAAPAFSWRTPNPDPHPCMGVFREELREARAEAAGLLFAALANLRQPQRATPSDAASRQPASLRRAKRSLGPRPKPGALFFAPTGNLAHRRRVSPQT